MTSPCQWNPVTREGAVGTNLNIGDAVSTSGNNFPERVIRQWSRLPKEIVGVSVLGDTPNPSEHGPGNWL